GVNYYQTNVVGTRNLIGAARKAGVKRIVELGGLGTQHSSPSSYMETRYEADQALKSSGLAWSILGPSAQTPATTHASNACRLGTWPDEIVRVGGGEHHDSRYRRRGLRGQPHHPSARGAG
ncbi:MAG TPA: NAD(P)H-binding protein, partial [Ktedonobacterales bacterium]|nr:NAD(P)H-binding protein [Ktedonobacterales bacterium]